MFVRVKRRGLSDHQFYLRKSSFRLSRRKGGVGSVSVCVGGVWLVCQLRRRGVTHEPLLMLEHH